MTETFNLAFFTNTNDKIYIMSMRGVKVDIEEDLLAVTPHGIAGYKKGGEVYNYLHSNFGDEKRGVFEIPFKNIKNIAINEAQMGLRVLACIEFGGHGIIIFGLKSKTIGFTRKLTTQIEKCGYKVGSEKQNMPELKITNEDGEDLKNMSPWKKYLMYGFGVVCIIYGVIYFLSIMNKSSFESVMYNDCVSEGKVSKELCSCFSKELDKKIPEEGKKKLLKLAELSEAKSSGNYLRDLKTTSDSFQYIGDIMGAYMKCGKFN